MLLELLMLCPLLYAVCAHCFANMVMFRDVHDLVISHKTSNMYTLQWYHTIITTFTC